MDPHLKPKKETRNKNNFSAKAPYCEKGIFICLPPYVLLNRYVRRTPDISKKVPLSIRHTLWKCDALSSESW